MTGPKPRPRGGAPRRGSLWWLALATLANPLWVEANQLMVPECEGIKIGILDLNDLSEAANVPKCTLNDVRPNPSV
jgi:hypothetical protein